MATKAGLRFINFEVTKLLFDRGDELIKEGEFEIKIQHITEISDNNPNLFRTILIITIVGNDNSFNLQVQSLGNFEIIGSIPNKVRENYLHISSPSIIYPYLRAYISNVTLQAGMQPIIIPPMNFSATPPQSTKKKKKKN